MLDDFLIYVLIRDHLNIFPSAVSTSVLIKNFAAVFNSG